MKGSGEPGPWGWTDTLVYVTNGPLSLLLLPVSFQHIPEVNALSPTGLHPTRLPWDCGPRCQAEPPP